LVPAASTICDVFVMPPASDAVGRDWGTRFACEHDKAVSSVMVSSTGWLSKNGDTFAGRSSIDSSHTSASALSWTGDLHQHSFQELQCFNHAFSEPLMLAQDCMRQADEALVEGVEHVMNEATAMMNLTLHVTAHIFEAAQELLDQIPKIMEQNADADAGKAIGIVHSILTQCRKEAQHVRADYIKLLDKVAYVGQCTEVRIDQNVMSQMDAPEQDIDGNFIDTCLVLKLDEKLQQEENGLRFALVHLDTACKVLEECPEFWLMLHKTELQLSKLERKASTFTSSMRPISSPGPTMEILVMELQRFCEEQRGKASPRSDVSVKDAGSEASQF